MEPSGSAMPSVNHTLNSTCGCPWELSDKARLCRFLCYGSEGDKYTAREERRLGMDSAGALLAMLQEGRGCEVVEEIKRFAQDDRAARLNPSIFSLAVCSQHTELKTRQAAFRALKEVCRVPAHLFTFIQYKKELKEGMKCGIWGRALRKAVSDWYNEQDAMSLALAVTKCKQREGWTHRDLLRLSHTKPAHETTALINKYVTKGWKDVQLAYADKDNSEEVARVLSYLEVVEKVKHTCDELEVAQLIEEHMLDRDQLLTDHLKSKQVWRALLKEMTLQSVLRILGKMTVDKVLEVGSSYTAAVCDRIHSESVLKKAKIHPFSIFLALEDYKKGQGSHGKTKWEPITSILKALESAFYKSFMNVEPVGKRFAVAVDVSAALTSVLPGTSVSTAFAAAAIAMIIARTEADTQVLVYSEGAVVPCTVSADMSLADVVVELVKIPSGSTDCSLPITWATDNHKPVDVFVVLSNSPCLSCSAIAVEALRTHRQKSGSFSKLVVCSLSSNGQARTDTEDRGFLNISGFDLGAVNVIRNLSLELI